MHTIFRWMGFLFIVYAVLVHSPQKSKVAPEEAVPASTPVTEQAQPVAPKETTNNKLSAPQPAKPLDPEKAAPENLSSIVRVEPGEGGGVVSTMVAKAMNAMLTHVQLRPQTLGADSPAAGLMPFTLLYDTKGKGLPAFCGARVGVFYQIEDRTHKHVIATRLKGEPLTLALGSGSNASALEKAVLGMREGGERAVLVPYTAVASMLPFEAQGKETAAGKDETKLLLRLHKIYNAADWVEEKPALQIFFKKTGTGVMASCGDKVGFSYQIKSVKGDVIYPKQGVAAATIGLQQGQAPFAMEKVLYGMRVGEERMVLATGNQLTLPASHTEMAERLFPYASLDPQEIYQLEINMTYLARQL